MVPYAGQLQAECHVGSLKNLPAATRPCLALMARASGFAESSCSQSVASRPAVCPLAARLLELARSSPTEYTAASGRIASHLVYSQATACQSMLGIKTAALRPDAGHGWPTMQHAPMCWMLLGKCLCCRRTHPIVSRL